jgi:hypothetical protein
MATQESAFVGYNNQWTEPESTVGVFPYNNVTQTESGHSLQFDDTPEKERIRLQHRAGTFIDMHPNGNEVHKVFGDGYEITIKNKNVLIKGVCNITVDGDCNMKVGGDYTVVVDGDYNLTTKGNYTVGVKKDIKISSDEDIKLSSSNPTGSVLLDGGGAGGELIFNSNIRVDGDLTAFNLFAQDLTGKGGRVDAAGGVSAGPLGFTSGFGGLSLGVPSPETPVAVPGSIFTDGPITSLTSVISELGFFGTVTCGIMDAVLMTDIITSAIYNSHIHTSPKGPTSPPLMRFFGV